MKKETLKMVTQARQGDTFIINKSCKLLSKETKERLFGKQYSKKVDFDSEGRLPIAYGEVSGHAHAVYDEEAAEMWVSKDVLETQKLLKVKTKNAVQEHEEHAGINIPIGDNVVLNQHEWSLEKIRRVAD